MAKTQKKGGQYRQMLLEQKGQPRQEEEAPFGFFRIKFYICLCLFVGYMILDYTKASFYAFDSSRIYAEISRDMAQDFDVEEAVAKMMDSVWISE